MIKKLKSTSVKVLSKVVNNTDKYSALLANIGMAITTAMQQANRIINMELVKANFEIGRHIIEFEQQGEERSEYGSDLLVRV